MTPPADEAAATPARVLLVDEQPANLVSLEAVLQSPGYRLVRAASGEEALRRLLHDDYAALLLGVQMVGLDGFETARLVRARAFGPHADRFPNRLRQSGLPARPCLHARRGRSPG